MSQYLLIRRSPQGKITAHGGTVYRTVDHAAAAAKGSLISSGVAGSGNARLFGDALGRRPLGTIWGHPSGYDFRILAADFTDDGAPITPGARLLNYYDNEWGTIEPTQFMHGGLLSPGGIAFDGWYNFTRDKDGWECKLNGQRLAAKEIDHDQ